MRTLRKEVATLRRAHTAQKNRADRFENKFGVAMKEITQLRQRIKELEGDKEKLEDTLDEKNKSLAKLQGMIFKPKNKEKKKSNKKRGGQPGHKGTTRPKPDSFDEEKHYALSHCPNCDNPLKRSKSWYTRFLEDIPEFVNHLITKITIERQWCGHCKKEVTASPPGVLPGFRFGLRLMLCSYSQVSPEAPPR